MVGPLIFVTEAGLVARLVVGRVQVVHTRLQAGFHQCEILIGQGHVDQYVRPDATDQIDRLRDVVRIDGLRSNRPTNFLGDLIAFRFRATGQANFAKDIR